MSGGPRWRLEWLGRALGNPIVTLEGTSRMRSWRAPLAITLYLGLLGGFGFAVYQVGLAVQPAEQRGQSDIGALVFASMAFFQLSLVCLFAPALAAGSISNERERQTFDMLLVSQVTELGIVVGKLIASIGFQVLLIVSALPMFAVVFLFGGIDGGQFALTQVLTIGTAITLAAVSVAVSAGFRTTLPATVTSYAVSFGLVAGTLVFGYLFTLVLENRGAPVDPAPVHPLLYANPFYAQFSVLTNPSSSHVGFSQMLHLLLLLPGGEGGGPALDPWQTTLLAEAVITGIAAWTAVRLVRGYWSVPPSTAPPAPAEGERQAD